MNLLNIVTLLTLRVVLGDHPTRLTTILTILKYKFSMSILTETGILLSQLYVKFQKTIPRIIHQHFGHVSIIILKQMAIKVLVEVLPENLPDLDKP